MDSALRRYSVVLARLSQTQRLAEGVAGRFFGQSPGRGQLEARMQDAGRDQRYDPIPLRRRPRVDQAGKAQPLEGAERRGDMAVGQGAFDIEGFGQAPHGGSALEQHAPAFDHFGGPFRQVGQRAFLDFGVLAVGLPEKHGGGRVAAGLRANRPKSSWTKVRACRTGPLRLRQVRGCLRPAGAPAADAHLARPA